MYSQSEHDRLIQAMRANGVTSLEVEADGETLRLDLHATPGAPAQGVQPASAAPRATPVTSPGIGRFLARGSDDGLPALNVPAVVQSGEVLGYVQQGSARLPVTAGEAGQLTQDAPANGTVFGFGDEIFQLEASL